MEVQARFEKVDIKQDCFKAGFIHTYIKYNSVDLRLMTTITPFLIHLISVTKLLPASWQRYQYLADF